jgi:chromosome segregation ATPase
MIAAVLVAAAIPTGQALLSVLAGIAAVALGAVATRITYSELIQSRRDAQQDRSALAKRYAEQAAQRARENAAFATLMTTRLTTTEQSLNELEQALGAAQKRAAEATRKFNTEARRAELAEGQSRDVERRLEEAEERAAEAILRVAELEQELDVARAEITAWQTSPASYRHAQ